jgi:hypothetical protein
MPRKPRRSGQRCLTVDALHMVLIAVLVFLLLRQVMPIAAGLAGGVALSSMGFVSRGVGMAARSTRRDGGKAAEPMAVYSAPGHVAGHPRLAGVGGASSSPRNRKSIRKDRSAVAPRRVMSCA